MSGYSWISVLSLFCYLFLFLTFLVAEKSKKVIYTFMMLLVVMILWNGGSFCMRMQLWPSVNFWHHVSLLGMLMLPVGYYHFVLDFLEERGHGGKIFWGVFYLLVFAVNYATGFFVPLPEVVLQNGKAQFLYHYNWHIYLLVFFIVLTLLQLSLIIRRHCLGNRGALRHLLPVIWGVVILLLGHILSTLTMFTGLPLDIISGVANALCLFYALYKKRLFRLTLLLSKTNYYVLAMVLGAAIFSNFALSFQRFLVDNIGMEYAHAEAIIVTVLVVMIAVLYVVINSSFDAIFERAGQQQNELIARFGEEITHKLNVTDILQGASDTVQKAVEVSRVFVCLRGPDGQYHISHTTNPLDEKNFYICADHPLVSYFKNHTGCLTLREFSRMTIYRGMWEKEKQLLNTLNIAVFVPLVSEGDLVGMVLLAEKENGDDYQPNELRFLQSVSSICAAAVKNAHTYEKAVTEARKDELTGLANRKYFFELLDREFETHKDTALSLCLINIDDFKLYNQLYGTQEGNLALQRVADILSSSVSGNGWAARIDGKEFALILPGYDIYSAKCLTENVAAQIGEINSRISGSLSRLTVSAGICAVPYMASSPRELLNNADTAVRMVKHSGKNAVLMYSAEIHRREVRRVKYKSGYNEHASTIYALTAAIDTKDHYTFRHSQNVAYYATELAKAAGMEADLVEIVKEAGLLHDIGKIGIREDILNKPGKLTSDEYDIMKGHVENAVNIIRYLPSLDYVIPTVLSHHERYDGTGYPRKLAGEEIPVMGRILSIADAFDAITSTRSYKNAIPLEKALRILREEAGRQFDPNLVSIFIALVEDGKIEIRSQAPGVSTPPPAPIPSKDPLNQWENAPKYRDLRSQDVS